MKVSPLVAITTVTLASQASAGFFSTLGCGVVGLAVGGGCHATVTFATGGLGAVGCHTLATGTFAKCATITILAP